MRNKLLLSSTKNAVAFAVALLVSVTCAMAENVPEPMAITNGIHFEMAEATPVALLVFIDKNGETTGFCSGTLVGKKAILTAAHCVQSKKTRGYAYIGGEWIKFSSASVHPKYNSDGYYFDLAVVKLSKRVRTVAPAAVMTSRPMPTGTELSVFGYGNTETGRSGELYLAYLPVGTYWNDSMHLMRVGETNICFGDSGGPAAALVDGAFTLVGVASTIHAPSWGGQQGVDICLNSGGMTFMNLTHPDTVKFLAKQAKDARKI